MPAAARGKFFFSISLQISRTFVIMPFVALASLSLSPLWFSMFSSTGHSPIEIGQPEILHAENMAHLGRAALKRQSSVHGMRYLNPTAERRGAGKPETFDSLALTHICGRSRQNGKF